MRDSMGLKRMLRARFPHSLADSHSAIAEGEAAVSFKKSGEPSTPPEAWKNASIDASKNTPPVSGRDRATRKAGTLADRCLDFPPPAPRKFWGEDLAEESDTWDPLIGVTRDSQELQPDIFPAALGGAIPDAEPLAPTSRLCTMPDDVEAGAMARTGEGRNKPKGAEGLFAQTAIERSLSSSSPCKHFWGPLLRQVSTLVAQQVTVSPSTPRARKVAKWRVSKGSTPLEALLRLSLSF